MENLLIIEALSIFGDIRGNGKRFHKTKRGQMSLQKGQRILTLQELSLTFTTENSAEGMVKHGIRDIYERKQ